MAIFFKIIVIFYVHFIISLPYKCFFFRRATACHENNANKNRCKLTGFAHLNKNIALPMCPLWARCTGVPRGLNCCRHMTRPCVSKKKPGGVK